MMLSLDTGLAFRKASIFFQVPKGKLQKKFFNALLEVGESAKGLPVKKGLERQFCCLNLFDINAEISRNIDETNATLTFFKSIHNQEQLHPQLLTQVLPIFGPRAARVARYVAARYLSLTGLILIFRQFRDCSVLTFLRSALLS